MTDTPRTFAADTAGVATEHDPLSQLAATVAAAKAEAEAVADTPITIADVAAAAFVALETVVALLGDQGVKVIAEFEERAAAFAASFEEADTADGGVRG